MTYINCTMGPHIKADGCNNWGKADNEKTARYAEYNSKTLDGKPFDVAQRMAWTKQIPPEEAANTTVEKIFGDWAPSQGRG